MSRAKGRSKIKVVDHGANSLLKRLAARVVGAHVQVGILADAPKKVGKGEEPTDLTLVEIAALHEFGAPGAGIPQRSFVRGTVDAQKGAIQKLQKTLATQVFKGKIDRTKALDLLGMRIAAMIKKQISVGISPPLAASTVAEKGSSKPLINTGQLRSAITWFVKLGRG